MNMSRVIQQLLQGVPIGSPIANDMGGGGGGTVNTIQNADPWKGVQPYLYDVFGNAQQNFSHAPVVGSQSPYTKQAQDLLAQRGQAGSPLTHAAQQQTLDTINGKYLDPATNPALQSAMGMAKTGINAQFSGDNFGNSAHQEWLSKGLLQAAAPFYDSERQRQTGAVALAPTLANQDYTDIGQLGTAGTMQDTRAQQVAEEPWQRLFNYQRAVSGQPGGSSSGQQPYFSNPFASALGLGIGGLGLYNGLTSAGLLGGGAAAGAGLGTAGMGDLAMLAFA